MATTIELGYDEMIEGERPMVIVIKKEVQDIVVVDSTGRYEGRYVRTWAGVNILYDEKWRQVYQMKRY